MPSQFAEVLASVFNAPLSNAPLDLIKHLKTMHPSSQHVSMLTRNEDDFPLFAYLSSINVSVAAVEEDTHNLTIYDECTCTVFTSTLAGAVAFEYEETEFRAYEISYPTGGCDMILRNLVFEGADVSLGQELVKQVNKWANSVKEQIWVFEGGYWSKSKQLYKAIREANWDKLVLDDALKVGLQRDTEIFFSSREVYRSLGTTWKRGILLLGPPGNGKTEAIKALLKDADRTVLYAKSFSTQTGPEDGVRSIFNHAREHSPCILVIEDVDAMVTDEVRSYFLNELDGLAENDGILTIATTNHPERIDDAIVNRPSRFDVKYTFPLPNRELRTAFILKWINKIIATQTRSNILFDNAQEFAAVVAERTEGWSLAFLKELFVSFILRVSHDNSKRERGINIPVESSESLVLHQIDQLAAQIVQSKDDITQSEGTIRVAHASIFKTAKAQSPSDSVSRRR